MPPVGLHNWYIYTVCTLYSILHLMHVCTKYSELYVLLSCDVMHVYKIFRTYSTGICLVVMMLMNLLNVQEWGASCPEFVAAYRLEPDMSWTPAKGCTPCLPFTIGVNHVFSINKTGGKCPVT